MEGSTSVAAQAIEAVASGLSDIASSIGNAIVVIVPIALGVVGAVIAVKFGIRFFRSLVK